MYILALSDIHEKISKLKTLAEVLVDRGIKLDVVVVAGDLTYFKTVDTAVKILEKTRQLFNTMVLFIPGNCDPVELLNVRNIGGNIVNLHGTTLELNGVVFSGIGGSGITPFNTMIEFSEVDFRELVENTYLSLQRFKDHMKIVVTHQPIHGFFDEVNGVNTGSRVFREYLDRIKPTLWITGHIHEHSGWSSRGETIILHPGPLMKGYYGLVKITDGRVESIEINKV